jgi:hypothetical protein
MDADFYNQILSIIESLEASKKIINETKTNWSSASKNNNWIY